MPEGHTVHRVARDHQKWFAGQTAIVLSPQGRFAAEAAAVSGRKLKNVRAHGKHLFYHWTKNRIVHVHFGLYGRVRLHRNPPPAPRGAVRLRLIGIERSFDLNGPNCCELIDASGMQTISNRLGEDPLSPNAQPEQAWRRISKSRVAIGKLLIDQSIIAGLGNIFRADLLFRLQIHPNIPGNQLRREQFDEIWKLAKEFLRTGVKYNRIITVDPNRAEKPLGRLKRQERILIYKKSHCPACNHKVRSWELGNRSMFACENCQR